MNRGFFGVGIWYPTNEMNVGTLWRSAFAFGAAFVFTIGRRYKKQCTDTACSTRHVPCFNYSDLEDFNRHRPLDTPLVVIELAGHAESLPAFVHPERAVYLLGSEGGGLPTSLLSKNQVVEIPSSFCLNVAVAGSIVLYDRASKMKRGGQHEVCREVCRA